MRPPTETPPRTSPHFQAGKTPSVPRSLWDLFSGDRERAIRATGDLWAGLCHQHAYISSAALPAYDFLMIACGSWTTS